MNRRQFFRMTAGATALLAFRRRAFGYPVTGGGVLTKYAQPMRGTLDIGVLTAAQSDAATWVAPGGGASFAPRHHTIYIKQLRDQLHPAMPLTKLWGYSPDPTPNQDVSGAASKHLGPIIVASKGTPIQLSFQNLLPAAHILPVDVSSFFFDLSRDDAPHNMVAVHLHGGAVPWMSDGGPFDWWVPAANGAGAAGFGPSFMNHYLYPANQSVPGSQAPVPGWGEYYYPNQKESARLMWYHDHAHDLTRLNAYAGIASGYLVTDAFEGSLISSNLLPPIVDARHNPMIFQDKIFDVSTGGLLYPDTYEGARWTIGPTSLGMPFPSCIPEMFGDTMLVNGTVSPSMTVEPRRYRFRVLDACNARFMNLQLYVKGNGQDITLAPLGGMDPNQIPPSPVYIPTNAPGPAIVQIGTEGGFLPAPVVLATKSIRFDQITGLPNQYTLLMSPGERADIVIDFSAFAGQTLILYSDTPAPFPGGEPANDYYFGTGGMSLDATCAPATRTIMQFVVNPVNGGHTNVDSESFNSWLSRLSTALASRVVELRAPSSAGAIRRRLSLNEDFDAWGRLIQEMGTDQLYLGTGLLGRPLTAEPTESPLLGATEIWEIYNTTGDTHPIHFHAVNVQILDRQPFSNFGVFTGPARRPDANERGWKETVRMNPGEVTRVIMKFDLPTTPFTVPTSPRIAAMMGGSPPAGLIPGKKYHEFVYHCHILEHEEHDMMRPLVIQE